MRPIDGDALVERLERQREAYNEIYNMLEVGNPSQGIMYGKYTSIVETMIDVRHMPTLDHEPVRRGELGFYRDNITICPFCGGMLSPDWVVCPHCSSIERITIVEPPKEDER